jgi:hypothetical protein
MRDDRYQGTSLPRPVRKLCLMAEREADRVRLDRLREQAVAALISDANREISPEFRRWLRDHSKAPGLFSANELFTATRTGLRAVAVRAIAAMAEFARLADSPDGALAVQREAQLISPANPEATQTRLLRLLSGIGPNGVLS